MYQWVWTLHIRWAMTPVDILILKTKHGGVVFLFFTSTDVVDDDGGGWFTFTSVLWWPHCGSIFSFDLITVSHLIWYPSLAPSLPPPTHQCYFHISYWFLCVSPSPLLTAAPPPPPACCTPAPLSVKCLRAQSCLIKPRKVWGKCNYIISVS